MSVATRACTPAVHPRSIVIDVDDELSYWSEKLPDLECYRPSLPLDQYTRTLRFAYDSYLLHPHDSADMLMPCLRDRYMRIGADRRLDWQDAEPVVKAVWERLKDPGRR